MTLGDLVDLQADRLTEAGVAFGHGTTNAHDEAAWLVQWALDLPLDALHDEAGRPVSASERLVVDALIERRIRTRLPAAYLTQQAWLQGVAFYVDERVIVPRSFIAELIADASIDRWIAPTARRMLDLCTGNGSLAILAAMAWPDLRIDASDLSEDALAVARINVDAHQLGSRISLLRSDGLQRLEGPYDLILCNPPYVNAASMAALPPEYRAEPALALDGNADGGEDGMDFVRALLREAPRHMTEDAVLVLEIGNEREHFERAFPRLPALWLETSAGPDQVLLLTREALGRD
ncbi:50S ribosomal protein L3 N(5)-glutamine methyltransferase [uncultured Methylibium sp.]|uniref:50S ribosomal protein L3 N(5)-glutamine methyltransferase n=1 Tax=uncultured Methylibium sp. TaxID=381093 RepID=UPI0025FDAB6D|nr:50S ribosomal protein L3 N(5)-glutamine methyltransferase [uncultured Methylibium sp.]